MKNFKFLLTVILMPLAFNAYADGTDVVCGPWLQNVTQNEFTVMWMTGGKCLSWLETAPDDGSAFEACERPRTYRTIAGKRYTGTLHAVRVKGLEPGHSYRYRIYAREVLDDSNAYCSIYGKELNTGASGTVRTLDYGAGQCTFSMINDIHDRADLYRKLTDPLADKDIDFLLLNGDIISYAANIDTAACHTFGPAADMIRNLPLFFARGNHEGRGADACLIPGLFRTSTGEFYYIFRQGPVAFIVLDAGEDKPDTSVEYSGLADYDSYRQEELEWLKEAVKDPLFAGSWQRACPCSGTESCPLFQGIEGNAVRALSQFPGEPCLKFPGMAQALLYACHGMGIGGKKGHLLAKALFQGHMARSVAVLVCQIDQFPLRDGF